MKQGPMDYEELETLLNSMPMNSIELTLIIEKVMFRPSKIMFYGRPINFEIAVFIWTAQNGHDELVKQLLTDRRIDPSTLNNLPIIVASGEGQPHVVKLLLKDSRVNPAADNNLALRNAAIRGFHEVVKLLLADPRVDPSANDNYAVQHAADNGNHELITALLEHPVPLAYVRQNLVNFIDRYPAIKNALTITHQQYNPAFCKRFFELIGQEFLSKMSLAIAVLQQHSIPNYMIIDICPVINPLFQHYKNRKCNNFDLISVSNKLALTTEIVPTQNVENSQGNAMNMDESEDFQLEIDQVQKRFKKMRGRS